ncbi:hypothetical protein GCM10007918_55940 [Piscinibacter gummiphilus]|nr:hypothetical protein GCM10007918_55940 [Piscinibacter gummiphilus]
MVRDERCALLAGVEGTVAVKREVPRSFAHHAGDRCTTEVLGASNAGRMVQWKKISEEMTSP